MFIYLVKINLVVQEIGNHTEGSRKSNTEVLHLRDSWWKLEAGIDVTLGFLKSVKKRDVK